jgi:hypothetical protein
MQSLLTLKAGYYAPTIETLNLDARGPNEAQRIAERYAQSRGYGYWELKFNQYSPNSARLIRSRNNQLRIENNASI